MLSNKELGLLNRIQKKAVYEDKFFEKRSELEWFDELKKRGYFNPNPDTCPQESKEKGYYSIPQWNVLSYLEKVSQQSNTPGNEKYIDELLEIIRKVSNYRDSTGHPIDNYRTWYYFVKILLNLPNDKIPIDIIGLIPIWLDSKFDTMLQGAEIATKLLPKFLTDNPEDIKKAEKIIHYVTAFKPIPLNEERAKLLGKKEENKLVVDSHWLKEAFKKHSVAIGEKCTVKVVDDLTKKIKDLLKSEEDETYYSFYDEREHRITEPMEMLTFILKRVLLAKAKLDVTNTKLTLTQFIEDNYLYFPKMAIYVMGQTMDKYSDLCWEILESEKGNLLIEKTLHFGDELKHLLENLQNLTDERRKVLTEKIIKASKKYDFKDDAERYTALSKQEIYRALSHDQYFKNLYDEMKKITNVNAELHPAVGKVETRWGPGPSPIPKEEIIKMSNDKLAEFLAEFRTKDSWRGPTVGGLSDLMAEVAKEMPEKFVEDFSPLKDTRFIYIYEILKGIKDYWNEKKIIDWNKLFNFIITYINRKEYWKDNLIVEKNEWLGGANHQWIAGIVSELIQDGTRDDDWAFPEQHFEKAQEIVFLLLENLNAEEDKDITDYVTYTLNTPVGKAITALILLSLRIARVNDKKGVAGDTKWASELKEKYEELLKSNIIEGFTNLGRYMPNFYYLDKEWITEKINSFENKQGNKYWQAFMDGYLSIGTVYEGLYRSMKPHYEYGLSHDFKDRHSREHLIQHICIGYLRDEENLDEQKSLFNKILDAWKPEQIKEIIGFFWMQKGYMKGATKEDEKLRTKIMDFWKLLYEKYKETTTLTEEDKKILSNVAKLATILPQINKENYEWLKLSASYVSEEFNSSFFIEYLDELKDKGNSEETAKYIGEIFLKMLEKFTPDHDKKNIRSIVEFLCISSNTEDARKICNIYGQIGYEFLKDIYNKFLNK
jgi:hypothetical protein